MKNRVELKDKIAKQGLAGENIEIASNLGNSVKIEALSALVTLGINKAVAEKNINSILKTHGEHITLEELIKLSLKS